MNHGQLVYSVNIQPFKTWSSVLGLYICGIHHVTMIYILHVIVASNYFFILLPQYATRSFSDMNTNPAPERTWSLSSKEVKALSHATGSDYVYALTEDEVRKWMDFSHPSAYNCQYIH